jgi:hypothetical protein
VEEGDDNEDNSVVGRNDGHKVGALRDRGS